MLAKCLVREIKEERSNSVASDPWNPWKRLKTPEMIDTSEKVPEIPWKLGESLEKFEKKPVKIEIMTWHLEIMTLNRKTI